MTLHQMLAELRKKFDREEDPAVEARALMRAALDLDFNGLVLNDRELSANEKLKIEQWTDRRLLGEPLAYISGEKAFYKYEFKVEPGILIPRPETELLVTVGLKRARRSAGVRIADLGCGSGCVGLTLLKELENSELFAVDASETACRVTAENAAALGVQARVYVLRSDVKLWRPEARFDLIVANPPYIPEGDSAVEKNVHKYEPHEALYSGADGFQAIREWVSWAPRYLREGGVMALEIGAGQSAAVVEIMEQAGFSDVQIQKDFAGIDRIISGKRGPTHG
jgi:release factor glutamine methyltransferase